jgi:beta-glucosidase
VEPKWDTDQGVVIGTADLQGQPIGWQAESDWLLAVPWGFRKLLVWLSATYPSLPLFVTENGVDVADTGGDSGLNDLQRIRYYGSYLDALWQAKYFDNVDVRAYYAWSLLDNFEWAEGFTCNFGFYRIDRAATVGAAEYLRRIPRASVSYFQQRVSQWEGNSSKTGRASEMRTNP